MPKPENDMIRGTLDMLILKIISIEAMHGWGISERIQQASDEALQVNQGSLYSSLHRLTRQGWIRSEWRRTPNNRRARYEVDMKRETAHNQQRILLQSKQDVQYFL